MSKQQSRGEYLRDERGTVVEWGANKEEEAVGAAMQSVLWRGAVERQLRRRKEKEEGKGERDGEGEEEGEGGEGEEPWGKMPPSVGWMFLQPCNFACHFCFARFEDLRGSYLSKDENMALCELLATHFDKLTFLGGEPTLSPYLPALLRIAKSRNRTTSIITNAFRLSEEYLSPLVGLLDWVLHSLHSLSLSFFPLSFHHDA
jgi:sulfatase maturation enzyme AslB (radical SAM superfamily)